MYTHDRNKPLPTCKLLPEDEVWTIKGTKEELFKDRIQGSSINIEYIVSEYIKVMFRRVDGTILPEYSPTSVEEKLKKFLGFDDLKLVQITLYLNTTTGRPYTLYGYTRG